MTGDSRPSEIEQGSAEPRADGATASNQTGSPADPVRYFSAESGPEAGQVYRVLSLPALLGFCLSALYAVVVIVLALVAYFNGKPMLLAAWSAAVPLAALGLCLFASTHIRNSEGTLAGQKLVRWGVLLSVFVGLSYWAYYAAIYFAVRQQARSYAEAWLELLREGELSRSCYHTIPPIQRLRLRLDDPNLAEAIEEAVRPAAQDGRGPPRSANFTLLQNRLIRMLLQGGKESRYELLSVRSWDFVRGGYEVVLDYRFTVEEGTFDGRVTVFGGEAPHDEYAGREWFIDIEPTRTQVNENPETFKLTDLGLVIGRLYASASEFSRKMASSFNRGERLELFLSTVPQKDRLRARKELGQAWQAGAAGGVAAQLALPPESMNRLGYYLGGAFITADSTRLRDDKDREELLEAVRKVFRQPQASVTADFAQALPFRSTDGDRLTLRFDVSLTAASRFTMEGILEIEGDAGALKSAGVGPNWRLSGLKVLTGRKLRSAPLPMMPPGQRMPPGMRPPS